MSVPITSSLLTTNTGYPIPTTFSSGSSYRISAVNGPAYVTIESRRQSVGMYTSSANFLKPTIDSRTSDFSNIVDTSIVSGDFITAVVVGSKSLTGSFSFNVDRDLPANELYIKVVSPNPDVYISEIKDTTTFSFTIDTTKPGSSSTVFELPLGATFGSGGVPILVDWGDGSSDLIASNTDSAKDHTYSTSGVYPITMTPTTGTEGINGFSFNNTGDKEKIIKLESFGDLNFNVSGVFRGCVNLTNCAPDSPLSFTSAPSFMFATCNSIVELDVTRWDVSMITGNMGFSFSGCKLLTKFDPSGWDVSNVTNMNSLFKNCDLVDFSMASWDLSSVTTMTQLLRNADGGPGPALSTANYDATLIGWAANPNTPDSLTTDFGGSTYTGTLGTLASSSRSTLIQKGWTISDGGTA